MCVCIPYATGILSRLKISTSPLQIKRKSASTVSSTFCIHLQSYNVYPNFISCKLIWLFQLITIFTLQFILYLMINVFEIYAHVYEDNGLNGVVAGYSTARHIMTSIRYIQSCTNIIWLWIILKWSSQITTKRQSIKLGENSSMGDNYHLCFTLLIKN